MATKEQTDQLASSIKRLLEFEKKSLVSRPQWGTINFSKADHDFNRLFSLLNYLDVLPLEYLTDNAATSIQQGLDAIPPYLTEIDAFNIERPNSAQLRDGLIQNIHKATDTIYASASSWVPFLAYQKGDVTKNIEKLSSSVAEASGIIDKAKSDIEKKAKEIDEIIIKAREASAQAGAAVFTKDFDNEATELAGRAEKWLWAAALFGLAALSVAVFTWFWTQVGLDSFQLWQKVASKIVALSILFSATLWCGRIYKALMHQSTMNRHRALSLQTFQAFSAAASDTQTKDAVLREATRTIFAPGICGYVDSGAGAAESESKIIEIAKSIAPSK